MTIFLVLLHILACLFLIMVVLLQTGKGADLAGAFGGGGSQTAFGARGATTLLHKLTTGSAVLFMITSLTLAIVASRPSGSVVQEPDPAAAGTSSPAATAPVMPEASAMPAEEGEGASPASEPPTEQPPEEPSESASETP
ncbi:MAG: preprotein translocase subunit SecG [Acidobacteriota bacterium]|jgi:preprotein translocase subunit SecG